ncbi:hypothetical protein ONS95_011202 [Cadophora gregata]|uniref:uncharacterized protein n=1 Tax=Cadophora gregata TaxID=51156 RepID=UPI0026DAB070|nr:uncharacterized protein ONS95_011202 [Cadophora gregata]KAK0119768.1 hypothetical protein ONS95_011202 [Cadophora gregata]KAK0120800.1 hypothetical protein ONS96_011002 [Cadophora gregata f. sp. sojae]
MDTLFKLKDTFVHFLSPAAKRRRTIGPGTPSTSKDHEYLAPLSEPRGRKAQAATFDHLNSKYPTTPQPKNPRKRVREDDEEGIVISPGDSVSQVSTAGTEGSLTSSAINSEELEENSEEEGQHDIEFDAEDEGGEGDAEEGSDAVMEEEEYSEEEDEVDLEAQEAAASEAKVQEYLARQKEFETIQENILKAKSDASWHPDALFLYERLALRSFEPLIPSDWRIDFPTLPEVLFTDEEENTFVNSNCLPSYRGIKALQALITLGIRVRDKLSVGGYPEKMVAKEIQNYIKWAERDGGYQKKRFIPVHTVLAARSSQTAGFIGVALASQMKFLAEQHMVNLKISDDDSGGVAKYSRSLPLLYGLVVAQTKVILVTHNSAEPDSESKVLATLDLTNKDMDVWNGFAIAFMIIASRNYIMSMKDELEPDNTMTDDEDA